MNCAEFKMILDCFRLDIANEYAKNLSPERQSEMESHVGVCTNCDQLAQELFEQLDHTMHIDKDECLRTLLLIIGAGITMKNDNITLLGEHSPGEITRELSTEQQAWFLGKTTIYYQLNRTEKITLAQTDPGLYWLMQEVNNRVWCAPTVPIAVERLKKIWKRETRQPAPAIDPAKHRN